MATAAGSVRTLYEYDNDSYRTSDSGGASVGYSQRGTATDFDSAAPTTAAHHKPKLSKSGKPLKYTKAEVAAYKLERKRQKEAAAAAAAGTIPSVAHPTAAAAAASGTTAAAAATATATATATAAATAMNSGDDDTGFSSGGAGGGAGGAHSVSKKIAKHEAYKKRKADRIAAKVAEAAASAAAAASAQQTAKLINQPPRILSKAVTTPPQSQSQTSQPHAFDSQSQSQSQSDSVPLTAATTGGGGGGGIGSAAVLQNISDRRYRQPPPPHAHHATYQTPQPPRPASTATPPPPQQPSQPQPYSHSTHASPHTPHSSSRMRPLPTHYQPQPLSAAPPPHRALYDPTAPTPSPAAVAAAKLRAATAATPPPPHPVPTTTPPPPPPTAVPVASVSLSGIPLSHAPAPLQSAAAAAAGAAAAATLPAAPLALPRGAVRLSDSRLQHFYAEPFDQLLQEQYDFTVIAIIGPEGCGKSTILSSFCPPLPPSVPAATAAAAATAVAGASSRTLDSKQSAVTSTVSTVAGSGSTYDEFVDRMVFPPASEQCTIECRHQTRSVQAYTTPERVILIDTPPIGGSASVLLEWASTPEPFAPPPPPPPPAGAAAAGAGIAGAVLNPVLTTSYEMSQLQLCVWLLSVCHVVIVVGDGVPAAGTGTRAVWRLLRSAEIIRSTLASVPLIRHSLSVPSAPELVFVFNKLSADLMSGSGSGQWNESIAIVEAAFAKSTLAGRQRRRRLAAASAPAAAATTAVAVSNGSGGLSAPNPVRSRSSATPAAVGSGGGFAVSDAVPMHVFGLPDSATTHIDRAPLQCGSFVSRSAQMRESVLALHKPAFTIGKITEREWLRHAARLWSEIRASTPMHEYAKIVQQISCRDKAKT